MADTYSAGEAARLLGVSERRVRQLAAAGALDVAQDKPLRIGARSVIDERKRRERRPKPEAPAQGLEPDQLRELVSAIVADVVPLALEGQRRVEELLREELAQSRAETAQLRAQLDERKAKRKGAGKGGKGKGGKGKRKLWGKP
jgi:DNA-binding transcriptional MerR regulator